MLEFKPLGCWGPRAIVFSLTALATLAAQDAQVGQPVPDFEFTSLARHDGRTRLSELRGQPVILGGWRSNLVTGLHAGWLADDLLARHGKKGLLVIMEDRTHWRGKPPWLPAVSFWTSVSGSSAWLTSNPEGSKTDYPIARSKGKTDRSLALIGVDGTLIIEGTAEEIREQKKKKRNSFAARFRAAVKNEMKRLASGWGADPHARTARALAFSKGKFAAALQALEKCATDEKEVVTREVEGRVQAWLKSVRFYMEEGRVADAERELKSLAKAVKGRREWEEQVVAVQETLKSPEMKREKALGKKLRKVLDPFIHPKPKQKVTIAMLKSVREIARKHGDTRVGKRAARLEKLAIEVAAPRLRMSYKKLVEKLEE